MNTFQELNNSKEDNYTHKAFKDSQGYKLYMRFNDQWLFAGRYITKESLIERAPDVHIQGE